MMRVTAVVTAVLAMGMACCAAEEPKEAKEEGFVPLFDGTSLDGWKASENAKVVSVRDGMICLEGGRSHLFYVGDVEKHDFKRLPFLAVIDQVGNQLFMISNRRIDKHQLQGCLTNRHIHIR